jgi:hypothetical protein
LVVSLSSIRLDRYFFDPKAARDDYRGIAEFITVTAGANDVILLVAPGQAEVFNYYYKGGLPVSALPTQRPMDRAATEPELDKLLARDKIYAVYWGNFEADPSNFIESWMNSHGYKTLDQWRGNVRLVVYVMPARRPTDEVVDGLNLPFGPDIILKGYRGSHLTPMAGEVTQLQLVWQALREPTRRYKVFMQLLDSYDQVVAQRDSEPVGDSRPTTTWDPGETVLDNHGVLLPPGTPPGDYRRIVGLYDAETGVRLRLPDGRDHFALPPVRVTRSLAPPPLAALNLAPGLRPLQARLWACAGNAALPRRPAALDFLLAGQRAAARHLVVRSDPQRQQRTRGSESALAAGGRDLSLDRLDAGRSRARRT